MRKGKLSKTLSVVLSASLLLGSLPFWGGKAEAADDPYKIVKMIPNESVMGTSNAVIGLTEDGKYIRFTNIVDNAPTVYVEPPVPVIPVKDFTNGVVRDVSGTVWIKGGVPGTEFYNANPSSEWRVSNIMKDFKKAIRSSFYLRMIKEDGSYWEAYTQTKDLIKYDIPDGSGVKDFQITDHQVWVLMNSGDVYFRGNGQYSGFLDGKDGKKIEKFTKIEELSNIEELSVSVNLGAALARTKDGRVFGWGLNMPTKEFYKTKTDEWKTPREFTEVPKAKQIAAGTDGSLILTEDNELYGYSYVNKNSFKQTTDQDGTVFARYDLLDYYLDGKPVQVVISGLTPFVMTDKGSIYSWGNNNVNGLAGPVKLTKVVGVMNESEELPTPTNLKVTTTSDSLTASWDSVNGADSYVLKVGNNTVYSGSNLSYTVHGLLSGQNYQISVNAVKSSVNGKVTSTQVTTKKPASFSLNKFDLIVVSPNQVNIMWNETYTDKTVTPTVYRDGVKITTKEVNGKRNLSDIGGIPGQTHQYKLIVTANDGEAIEETKSVTMPSVKEYKSNYKVGNISVTPGAGSIFQIGGREFLVTEDNTLILAGAIPSNDNGFSWVSGKNYENSDARNTVNNFVNSSFSAMEKKALEEKTGYLQSILMTKNTREVVGSYAAIVASLQEVYDAGKINNRDMGASYVRDSLYQGYYGFSGYTHSTAYIYFFDYYQGNGNPNAKGGLRFILNISPNTVFSGKGTQYDPYIIERVSDGAQLPKLDAPEQPLLITNEPNNVKFIWPTSKDALIYKVLRNGVEIGSVLTTEYTDKTAIAGESYIYTIKAFDGVNTSDPSKFLLITVGENSSTPDPESDALEKPINLVATPRENSIKLTWDVVIGATEYIVMRGQGVIYQGPLTTFTETDLSSGATYNYSVVASNGKKKSEESLVSATTVISQLPYPTNFRLTDLEFNKVRLEWDPVEGADEYEISRDGNTIGNPTSTWWVEGLEEIASGVTYTYKVSAIKNGVNGKVALKVVTVPDEPLVGEAPSGELLLKANRVYHDRVGLSWNTVTGATYYEVVQDETNKVWTGTLNTITDGNVGPEEAHTYKVIAANENGTLESNVIDFITPPAPQSIVITPTQPMEGTITFDFKVIDGAITYVERNPQTTYTPVGDGTYRKTYYNSATDERRDEGIVTPVNGKLNFSETGVDPSKNYHYDIVAVMKKADGTEEVVAKEEVSVNTPADGTGATVPGTIVDPGNGGGNTPTPNPGTGNGGGTTPTNPSTPGTGGSVTNPSTGGSTSNDTNTNGGSEGNGTVVVPGTAGGTDTGVITEEETDTSTSASFTDVEGSFAKEAILSLSAKGIVKGYADGTFGGKKKVTRSEFAIFINRALGYTSFSSYLGTFVDFNQEAWYATELNSALQNGITKGFNDNTYRPNGFIPREQAAIMLSNVLLNNGAVLSSIGQYDDYDSIVSWATESVDLVTQESVMGGYPGNKFLPKRELTREEAAQLIYNLIQSK